MRRQFSGQAPLFLQAMLVLAAAATMTAISFFSLTLVKDSAREAGAHAASSADAAELRAIAQDLRSTLGSGEAGEAAGTAGDASDVYLATQMLAGARAIADDLHRREGSRETLALWGAVEHAQMALADYAAGASSASTAAWVRSVDVLTQLTTVMVPQFQQLAASDNEFNEAVASQARVAIMLVVLVASITILLMTRVVGRRLGAAVEQARAEKEALAASAAGIARRNDQFEALYRVVTEISETLSVKYVVDTAVRESRLLVDADITDLRILRDGQLHTVGVSADASADHRMLAATNLGDGVTGRAAKRGRSVMVDEASMQSLVESEAVPGMRSGIVVPLIVGARVVGTMACWSRELSLFTSDDMQILELMASQVATAIVAADTHEVSEQQAHTDPLTSLPNRRQLAEDAANRFERATTAGSLSVAMIDIDHFKHFNDDFGHQTGDITLQKIADVIRLCMRDTDAFYR